MAMHDWKPFANLKGCVRLILCVDWDPIGVFGNVTALDEYDSYVDGIVELLTQGADQEALVAHLKRLATVNMCVPASGQDDFVAGKLLQVYAHADP